jgi:hypothetical protein
MRTEPLVGTKLWFGPRDGGWGWEPISWQGRIVEVVYLLAMVAPIPILRGDLTTFFMIAWGLGWTAALVTACVLKGTSGGGAAERAEFRRRATT